ncbi:MAG: alcohol dehydrogenase, partial [Actinomycetes bacterium]
QLARELGVLHVHTIAGIKGNLLREYDAVIDASSSDFMPQLALQKVLPGGTVVLIGLSETPSLIDTRIPVLQDVTIVGILSASPGLQGAIDYFASGAVDPEPLISEVIGFHQIADRLEGNRGKDAKSGPKIHVDPRIVR